MTEFEYKKEILISSIYDIFDSIDLLKSLLDLQDSTNKKRYFNFINKADSELNNLVYKLKYETEEPKEIEVEDINNSEYTVTFEEKELTEQELKKIIKDIKEFYDNRE